MTHQELDWLIVVMKLVKAGGAKGSATCRSQRGNIEDTRGQYQWHEKQREIRHQSQLAVDAKDSLKSRMRENRKYGSVEGRRQQCRPPTQHMQKGKGHFITPFVKYKLCRLLYGKLYQKNAACQEASKKGDGSVKKCSLKGK